MKKSGEIVPEWMLNLKQCDNKAWKKVEKKPTSRKTITTKPREHMPKKFLKEMDKHMKRSGMFNTDARDQVNEEEPEDEAVDNNSEEF